MTPPPQILKPLCDGIRRWCLWEVGFPGGSVVKNPPAMQETQKMLVWSLGGENLLEEEMATHSSIPAWRISWTEKPGGLQTTGSKRVRHDWAWTCRMYARHEGGALRNEICALMKETPEGSLASLPYEATRKICHPGTKKWGLTRHQIC